MCYLSSIHQELKSSVASYKTKQLCLNRRVLRCCDEYFKYRNYYFASSCITRVHFQALDMFSPALPEHKVAAIGRMGFGLLNKV